MSVTPKTFFVFALASVTVASFSAQAGLKDWLNQQVKTNNAKSIDPETAAAGLRQALEQGSSRAVAELGRADGFWKNPTLRIPMPEKLAKAERGLRRLGQHRIADDFVHSLNRAAEQATPAAREIFIGAIRQMTVNDALNILRGPDDAATQYFRRTTSGTLTEAFRPIVARATASVGVTANYKRLVKRAEPIGLINTRDLDIDDYVTRKALDGLFYVVAEEEKRIRLDPVARTTDLLRAVFGK